MTAGEQTDLERVTRDLKTAKARPMTVEEQATLERLTREAQSDAKRQGKSFDAALEAHLAQIFLDSHRFKPFHRAQSQVIGRILRSHGFNEKYRGETGEVADGKLTLTAYIADSPRVAMTAEEKASLEKVRRDLRQAVLEASNGAHGDVGGSDRRIQSFVHTSKRTTRQSNASSALTASTEGTTGELMRIQTIN